MYPDGLGFISTQDVLNLNMSRHRILQYLYIEDAGLYLTFTTVCTYLKHLTKFDPLSVVVLAILLSI